jgi:histone deacetylase 1/2
VQTANGAGMVITHIGHSVVNTPSRPLYLKNILYVPNASKNLISAYRLMVDTAAYFELYPKHFSLKDQATKETFLRGRCRGRLFPLPSSSPSAHQDKEALAATTPSLERWHCRLGHPSYAIAEKVVRNHDLPVSAESNKMLVCDACQKGKSHQLPFPKSSSVFSFPLELIYSDVWGPAPVAGGGKKYYVSFIDAFSRFTWIYFLKHKSEVFQKFYEF